VVFYLETQQQLQNNELLSSYIKIRKDTPVSL
jgi:hypothetical protein